MKTIHRRRFTVDKTEPFVAKDLREAHANLGDHLEALLAATNSSECQGSANVRARLGATKGHLLEHFRFEEQDGYMDAVRKQRPSLAHAIDQLAQEHGQLAQALEGLLAEADTAADVTDMFRDRVHRWVSAVRKHEERENDLVQDAFNLDIGTKD
jgi:hypothetical protein